MLTPRTLLTSTALAAVAAASLGVGAAHAQTPTDDAALNARLERACLRVPNLQIRTDNVLARITGDAATRGSLLWLDTQIAEAQAKGRDQLVDVLTNRRAVREQSVDVLELRTTQLAELSEICTEHGVTL